MSTDSMTWAPLFDKTVLFLACPFCGRKPTIDTVGTFIEVECCVSMSRQKSDYLTLEERGTWDLDVLGYSRQAETKALKAVADEWNRRAG